MTVDPEEFLSDLGFADTELRMRIPDRFFQSASSAQGIDVDSFRRSLETDDLYGSSVSEENFIQINFQSNVESIPGMRRFCFTLVYDCSSK